MRHLATGGMAEVYVARASGIEGFEKLVVIKRIRRELNGNQQFTQLFLEEARLVATLEHPQIAQVYDVGNFNGGYFFAMEYVQGADLRTLMSAAVAKKRPVSFADAIFIINGVCAALHFAHEKLAPDGTSLGIIHRDISPSNILLSYDGAVKVCDFGIAKARQRAHETGYGVRMGKIPYMSPEQCLAEPLDRRSDIYSICVLLYELTTLNRLVHGHNDFEQMKRVIEGPVPPPSCLRLDYPPDLERIVLTGLSKRREDRYATARELQLALEAFARERKLALSSVGVSDLVSGLLEDAGEVVREVPHPSLQIAEPLLQCTPPDSRDGPSQPAPCVEMSAPFEARSWRSRRFAFAAALVAAAGCAFALTIHVLSDQASRRDAAELEREAEKIAMIIDSEARAIEARADGISIMPMLRAAVETDAATVQDMATSELVFTPVRGQVLELFQCSGRSSRSLLRIPADAHPLRPLHGREMRIELSDGPDGRRKIVLVGGAPVSPLYRANGVSGAVAIAVPIDLGPSRRRLATWAEDASIGWLDQRLPLVAGGGGTKLSAVVPLSAEWNLPSLTLEAVPTGGGSGWLAWFAKSFGRTRRAERAHDLTR